MTKKTPRLFCPTTTTEETKGLKLAWAFRGTTLLHCDKYSALIRSNNLCRDNGGNPVDSYLVSESPFSGEFNDFACPFYTTQRLSWYASSSNTPLHYVCLFMILSHVSFCFNTFLLFFSNLFIIQLQNLPFYLRMERDIFESVLAITSLPKKPSKKQPDYHRPNGAKAITEVCF